MIEIQGAGLNTAGATLSRAVEKHLIWQTLSAASRAFDLMSHSANAAVGTTGIAAGALSCQRNFVLRTAMEISFAF